MDTGKILLLGGVAVGGYFAYQWYYGPGGYADRQACAADPTSADINFPGRLAYGVWSTAAAANKTALDYIASLPAATTAAQLALYACARVAVTKYPSLALAQAAATAEAAAEGGTVGSAVAVPGGTGISMSAISAPVGPLTLAQQQAAANAAAATAAPATSANSLDAIYTSLSKVAQAAGINLTTGIGPTAQGPNNPIDYNGWNYYLGQVYGGAIPNAGFPASAQSQPMTLAAYWSVMSPALASANGLSGLGIFGGLGAIVRSQKGW